MGHIIRNQEWFEEKVKNYHGDKVEILSEYNGSEKPINIVYHCKEHGDTYTTINAKNICKSYFLPCKKCQSINKSLKACGKKSNKDFYYNRLKDYSKSHGGQLLSDKWITAKTTYKFKCGNSEHPIFESTADALYSGEHWCPYCSGREGNFEDEIKEIIKSKGGELLSEYTRAFNNVSVKCIKHNYIWDITPSNLKKGRWCPICSMVFSEKVVWDYLTNNLCNIKPQYTFDDLLGDNYEKLKFDFGILNNKGQLIYLVEVDDEDHRYNHLKNKKKAKVCERDIIKNNYCKDNNINLYRMEVPFRREKRWDYDDYYRYINTELKFILNLVRMQQEVI